MTSHTSANTVETLVSDPVIGATTALGVRIVLPEAQISTLRSLRSINRPQEKGTEGKSVDKRTHGSSSRVSAAIVQLIIVEIPLCRSGQSIALAPSAQ
jgi:hypothetical protein